MIIRALPLAAAALVLAAAPAAVRAEEKPAPPAAGAGEAKPADGEAKLKWRALFDGKSLKGWEAIDYGGAGEVTVEDGAIQIGSGVELTGVRYTGELPAMNFEVRLEAKRISGYDFFCGLTFPAAKQSAEAKDGKKPPKTVTPKTFEGDADAPCCTLILGGWGGGLTGISSIDHMDAANNATTGVEKFEKGKWYQVRLRVTENRFEAWLGEDKIIDQDTKDKRLSMRPGDIEMSVPFGISTFQTIGAIRGIKIAEVDGPADPEPTLP